ncbi:hypothetical protein [Flavilitoribacter nigricans]|nr:hypothetical protein [Flavilitoribacter nigricans]
MLDALRYEFSVMTWKNHLTLWGILLFCYGIWVYLPLDRANYRIKRAKQEANYTSETPGQLLSIRKLYLPAGERGIIRFVGHELRYKANMQGRIIEHTEIIPKNPDPDINSLLKSMMDGETRIIVKFPMQKNGKSLVKLIP